MYSLKHQIEKAIHIANNDENVSAAVFCNYQEAQQVIMDTLNSGRFIDSTRSFIAHNQSKVRFFDTSVLNDLNNLAGSQFSHVFTRNVSDQGKVLFLRARIRSTHTYREPMGYYDEFGVQRYGEYWYE